MKSGAYDSDQAYCRICRFACRIPQYPKDAFRSRLSSEQKANCVFLQPFKFDWGPTQELLQFCTSTFPVCLVQSPSGLSRPHMIPGKWPERLRHYYSISMDASLPDLNGEIDYAVRGCLRYLLKGVIQLNLREIANQAGAAPQLADKALETASAIKEIEISEKSELGISLGLNAGQMRELFDEALSDARKGIQRSQIANFFTLGAGLLLLLATSGISLYRFIDGHSGDVWTVATGGMGAAATIAALVTSPARQIEGGVSRLIFIRTAYFSFLNQVRLLISLSPETTVQRSQQLGEVTDKLLDQLVKISGGDHKK